MDRPYIICQMAISLDGKVVGDVLKEERAASFTDLYENTNQMRGCVAG